MWTSFTSWLTPTSLFVLVNIVIATIAVTSRFGAPKTHRTRLPPHDHGAHQLLRSPSLLDRLRSFNFSHPHSETVHLPQPPSQHPDPNPNPPPEKETNHETHLNRSESDSGSRSPGPKTSLQRNLRKSLSEKLAWASWTAKPQEEEVNTVERRRPMTARAESSGGETTSGEHEEVDAKADDFINRFKQQLKLQRLESLLRKQRQG